MTARKPGRRKVSWTASELPEGLLPPEANRPHDWPDRGAKLVSVYNACLQRVAETTGKRAYVKRPNHNNREVFFGLHLWCAERGIDPTAWIYSVFGALSWRHPVGLRDLFNEKRRRTYDQLYEGEWKAIAGISASLDQPHGFKPLQDLHDGAEIAKKNYAARGEHVLCMINIDITLGFHPLSEVCPQCQIRERCLAQTEKLRQEVSVRPRLRFSLDSSSNGQ